MTYIRYLGDEKPSIEELTHFGVKGMHWGVRRAKRSAAKADKKWEKKATGSKALVQIHNAAANRMNRTEIRRINNKPQYKNKDFTKDSPLRRKYYKEFNDTYNRIMVEEHRKAFGSNPSGTKQLGLVRDSNGEMTIGLVDVKHADDTPDIHVKFDKRGYITSVQVTSSAMAQSEDLEHFGVKGMHWGVRKNRQPVSLADGYSQRQYDTDRRNFGNRGANRINERVKSGKSVNKARTSEAGRKVLTNLAKVGATIAVLSLAQAGATKIGERAVRNRAAAGARAAAAAFSDERGIANYSTIRLTYDAAKGMWR